MSTSQSKWCKSQSRSTPHPNKACSFRICTRIGLETGERKREVPTRLWLEARDGRHWSASPWDLTTKSRAGGPLSHQHRGNSWRTCVKLNWKMITGWISRLKKSSKGRKRWADNGGPENRRSENRQRGGLPKRKRHLKYALQSMVIYTTCTLGISHQRQDIKSQIMRATVGNKRRRYHL